MRLASHLLCLECYNVQHCPIGREQRVQSPSEIILVYLVVDVRYVESVYCQLFCLVNMSNECTTDVWFAGLVGRAPLVCAGFFGAALMTQETDTVCIIGLELLLSVETVLNFLERVLRRSF